MRHNPSGFFPAHPVGRPHPVRAARQSEASQSARNIRARDDRDCTVSPKIFGLLGLAFGFGIIGVAAGAVAGFGAWGLIGCYVVCGNVGLILALVPAMRRGG